MDANLRIYPNPATEAVWLEMESKGKAQPLAIRSMDGRVMLTMTADSGVVRISVEEWPAGVYVVQYGPVVRKLIVQQ